MERSKVQDFLNSVFGRGEDAPALSRRDALAGLGLAGLLLATPKLLVSSPAEAKPLDKPATAPTDTKVAENQSSEEAAADLNASDGSDATDLSSQYWRRRRRYWRRRWRRRHWRRRYYWRRPWRRRYWRRRWRRRYWW